VGRYRSSGFVSLIASGSETPPLASQTNGIVLRSARRYAPFSGKGEGYGPIFIESAAPSARKLANSSLESLWRPRGSLRARRQWYARFCVDVERAVPARHDGYRRRSGRGRSCHLERRLPKIRRTKAIAEVLKKLRRLSRALARKKLGSHNRAKAKTELARLHVRISNIRSDALHKLTAHLMGHRTIVIEDLNIAGMLANRRLSRVIADVGFMSFGGNWNTRPRCTARTSS
jgi:hypothetical protein